jgi:hypothetical protein
MVYGFHQQVANRGQMDSSQYLFRKYTHEQVYTVKKYAPFKLKLPDIGAAIPLLQAAILKGITAKVLP